MLITFCRAFASHTTAFLPAPHYQGDDGKNGSVAGKADGDTNDKRSARTTLGTRLCLRLGVDSRSGRVLYQHRSHTKRILIDRYNEFGRQLEVKRSDDTNRIGTFYFCESTTADSCLQFNAAAILHQTRSGRRRRPGRRYRAHPRLRCHRIPRGRAMR